MLRHFRLAATCLAAALAAVAILPATAAGHARLVGVEQDRGARAVLLQFDEPVSPVRPHARIRDARGRRVLVRIDYRARWTRLVRVPLPRLDSGRWTFALAVLSEDGHLSDVVVKLAVAREMTATAAVRAARAAPALAAGRGAARAARDGALTLAAGLALALLAVWLPALQLAAGATDAWRTVAADGLRRWLALIRLTATVAAGAAPLTVALDAGGADERGLWSSRAGLVAIALALAALALRTAAERLAATAPPRNRRAPSLEPATLGATGLVLVIPPRRAQAALLTSAGLLVVLAPLGGHAADHGPAAAVAISAIGHVAAVSAWLGALAVPLIAARCARALSEDERCALLRAVGERVARVAPVAVAGVVATGVVQAAVDLHDPGDLVAIAWGRLLLAKTFVLALMLAWAARNRRTLDRDPCAVARGAGRELMLAAVAMLAAALLAGAAPPS